MSWSETPPGCPGKYWARVAGTEMCEEVVVRERPAPTPGDLFSGGRDYHFGNNSASSPKRWDLWALVCPPPLPAGSEPATSAVGSGGSGGDWKVEQQELVADARRLAGIRERLDEEVEAAYAAVDSARIAPENYTEISSGVFTSEPANVEHVIDLRTFDAVSTPAEMWDLVSRMADQMAHCSRAAKDEWLAAVRGKSPLAHAALKALLYQG